MQAQLCRGYGAGPVSSTGQACGEDLWLERSVERRMIPDGDSGATVCDRQQ